MAGEKSFTKFGALVTDLQLAAEDRLADAKALNAANRPATAIATAIYAIEIQLKVLICHRLDLPALPKAFEIHDIDALLVLSGLSQRLYDPSAARVKVNWEEIRGLAANLNNLRYAPDRRWTPQQAATFLFRLEDPSDGVLSWLLRQQ